MKNKKVGIGTGVIIGITVLAGLIFLSIVKMPGESDNASTEENSPVDDVFNPPEDPDAEHVSFLDEREMNRQRIKEQNITKEYEVGTYTFDDPFIKVDPYEVMPLSAVLMFETEDPARIRVIVEGKDEKTSIERHYDNYETEHYIPVLGLYPNEKNTVKIDYMTEDGENTGRSEVTIETDPLPEDFLQPEVVEAQPEKMEDGLTFMVPTEKYMYALDNNADVRWYTTLPVRHAFEPLENGHILIANKDEARDQYNQLSEVDMLGKIYNAYMVEIDGYDQADAIHHDVIELSNGNLLAIAHEPDSKYERDQMIEIDRKTGETRRFINDRDLFPPDAYQGYEGKDAEDNDWINQNAIWYDMRTESILISGRNQDTIMKLSYPDAETEWILAAHEDWPESYDDYLLEPIGDVKFPAGQHAMEVLPTQDGDPDTMDILLFDNNTVMTRGDEEVSGTYSRAVQYRIHEENKTVEEVWAYGEDRGTDFYSSRVGNAQYLFETENRLITSGAIETEDKMEMSRIVEVTGDNDPEVVFEVATPEFEKGRNIYRAFRLPLYPEDTWDFEFGEPEDSEDT